MKEVKQSFQQETAHRISDTLEFDPEDLAASAAALYLQYDNIVEARDEVATHIADTWFLSREEAFRPTNEELNTGVLVFTSTAAYEAGKLLSDHAGDVAYFYAEVGTAIIGSEVEIFVGSDIETHPITTDLSPQKKRSDRDLFHRKFEDRLAGLMDTDHTVFESEHTGEYKTAAD